MVETVFEYGFEVAGTGVLLKTEKMISISDRFRPFLKDSHFQSDYEAVFHQVEQLPDQPEEWLWREEAVDVGKFLSGQYCRRFRDVMQNGQVYAVGRYDWDRKHIDIAYLADGEGHLNQSDNCFFHIAWETIMQLEKRMILHACAVDTAFGGILFSGKSGIGKSTQGTLWCEYEGARLVNGDRPLIRKENDVWYAYGAPYAGSSKCHRNIKSPVRAVVLLKQDSQCSIRRLRGMEAFRGVYEGMTISSWNLRCVENCCDLALALVTEIPVYEMACTPDRQAVALLKKTLLTEVIA